MKTDNLILNKSCDFALRIIKLCSWLRDKQHYELSKRLLKSGTSIGANASSIIMESEELVKILTKGTKTTGHNENSKLKIKNYIMWEQIRVNKRNSMILLGLMGAVLCGLGFVLGFAFGGGPEAGWMGIFIATCIWIVMMLFSLYGGDQVLLASSRAQRVTEEVHPQLFNIVEEMTIAANLPKMPKIYIINDPAPNAFATGRNPENASVAVTAGLLGKLNRDELQGVIAHEISHILHRDILYVTVAGVMLGAIVLLSQVFLRGMFYSSLGGRRYSSRRGGGGGGGAQALMMVLAILAAILAPLFAQILYFSLSRKREYLADAGAVRLTRYPEGLAGALEKIAGTNINMEAANQVTAPMYIANPFRGKHAMNLFTTHPPIDKRIQVLRNMSHGAGFKDYNVAYEQVTRHSGVIPQSAIKPDEAIGLRDAATAASAAGSAKHTQRQVGDIMRKVSGFTFIPCTCGLRLKLPPDFKERIIRCPRCKRTHNA